MASRFKSRVNILELAVTAAKDLSSAVAPILPVALCVMLALTSGCGGPAEDKVPPKTVDPKSDPATPKNPDEPPPPKPDPTQPNPAAVVIMLPLDNSQSPSSEVVVSGSCRTERELTLGGAVILSEVILPFEKLTQPCLDSRFSFTISKLLDGVFPFTVTQSGSLPADPVFESKVTWTKDSVAPMPISISKPAGGSVRNSSSSLIIAGDCETGAHVIFSGASDGDVLCQGAAFSFEFTATTDAVRAWAVKQMDLAGNVSTGVSVEWTRDSSQPLVPVILTPAMNSYSSNPVVVLSGTCQNGFNVHLNGAASSEVTLPAGALEQICISATYSFTIQKSTDGPYDFSIVQTDLETNVTSAPAAVTWYLDTVAPANIIISQPAGGSLTSADSALTIAGSCEPRATVSWVNLWTISGTANLPSRGAVECPLSGVFQVVMSSSVDGVFTWNFLQTDLANSKSTAVPVQWTRDSSVPVTPVITSPATSTVTNSQNELSISGTCVTGHQVTIAGDVVSGDMVSPFGSLKYTCAASSFSFTVSKMGDASFVFSIYQTNLSKTDSASTILTWVRDTQVPAAVQLTSPAGSSVTTAGDLVVAGSCESGATIQIAGATATTSSCVSGSFSATVSAVGDGVYGMGVTQTDAALNTSPSQKFTWTKDSSVPTTPIILVPSQSPYRSTSKSMTIQGSCSVGLLVEIAGIPDSAVTSPAGSLGQICSLANTFSWTITVALDGTYSLSIVQTNHVGTSSPAVLSWIIDSTAPDVAFSSVPKNPTLSFSSVFAFNSSDLTAIFRCSTDGAAETDCVSPLTLANLASGSHLFSVRAADLAGNVSAAVTQQWTINSRKTIALYHFDTAAGHLVDSSGYLAPYSSPLTVPSTALVSGAGKFGQADTFTATSYLAAAHNGDTQNLTTSNMTVEAFVKITSNPVAYFTIASKAAAGNDFGWKFQIKKSGTSAKVLAFNISTNGTTWETEALSATCSLSTTAYLHVAVTWSQGTVNFFCGGVKKGTKIIGTAGSTVIFPSTAPLYVGSLAGSSNHLGALDEVRISQMLRYEAVFTSPAAAFVGD